MQVQAQAATTDYAALTGASSTNQNAASTDTTSGTEGLANQTTFLQLLVAQIKNQDPLQPTDGVEFLSQLAQFSQLEQIIGMRKDIQTLAPTQAPTDNSGESAGNQS